MMFDTSIGRLPPHQAPPKRHACDDLFKSFRNGRFCYAFSTSAFKDLPAGSIRPSATGNRNS